MKPLRPIHSTASSPQRRTVVVLGRNGRQRTLAIIVAAALWVSSAQANSTGKTGSSGEQPDNGSCSACHTGGVALTVHFEGPAQLAAGGTGTFRFVVHSQSSKELAAGLDVAASAGTLGTISDQDERVLSGEITHTQPKDNDATGAASWDFTWQAPKQGETVVTLFGAGCSVDLNGSAFGDQSATATYDVIVLTPTPTVTPTATPRPRIVHIDVGAATGAPGGTVRIPVALHSSGFGTVATGNDITYRNDLFALAPEGCALNPDLPKVLTTGLLTSGLSSTVRIFVQSPENTTVIPDGLAYTCSFQINVNTLPGTYALANSSTIAFGPDGNEHDAVTGTDGGIVVTLVAAPTPTDTATPTSLPTATATITRTPTETAAPAPSPTSTPTLAPTPTLTSIACVGDCTHSGEVTVGELITMVNIALETAPLSACGAGDANGDGQITVDEILRAVGKALNGCS